jgi:hypothetical protein
MESKFGYWNQNTVFLYFFQFLVLITVYFQKINKNIIQLAYTFLIKILI